MARESEEATEQPHPLVLESGRRDIWNSLLALRTVNAILLCTFFQPDEFYQAQEPAWHLAFSRDAHRWANNAQRGAWMTWVCLPPHIGWVADLMRIGMGA